MPVNTVTTSQQITSAFLNTNYRDQVVSTVLNAGKPAGTEGQVVAVTDKDRLEIYSGTAWVRGPAWSSSGRTGITISRVANQSIANVTDTTITFDTETTDVDGFIAVSSDTITVPSGLGGLYAITGTVIWASSPGATSNARLEIGGVTGDYRTSVGASSVAFQAQVVSVGAIPLSATNTVKLRVYQGSGAAINVTARLEMWRIGS